MRMSIGSASMSSIGRPDLRRVWRGTPGTGRKHEVRCRRPHPNIAGSQLVACAVFSTIYNKPTPVTPVDLTPPPQ